MPHAAIDILTSPTLKHLRQRWWNDEFTEFLVETLKPRAGNRILDVGCGEGLAEIAIGRRQLPQVRMVGIDRIHSRVTKARRATAAHNQRVGFAAGDVVRLPFRNGVFDSTYCIAVLQHVPEADVAVAELARVTRAGGKVIAVEPDNTSRYAYSSVPTGAATFDEASRLYSAVDQARTPIGPRLAGLFSRCGIEPVEIRMFPVTLTFLGAPEDDVWRERRRAVDQLATSVGPTADALASGYRTLLAAYEEEARAAGADFVEIQNTTLFATVGQRREE